MDLVFGDTAAHEEKQRFDRLSRIFEGLKLTAAVQRKVKFLRLGTKRCEVGKIPSLM
jgi:hypothetical protein